MHNAVRTHITVKVSCGLLSEGVPFDHHLVLFSKTLPSIWASEDCVISGPMWVQQQVVLGHSNGTTIITRAHQFREAKVASDQCTGSALDGEAFAANAPVSWIADWKQRVP